MSVEMVEKQKDEPVCVWSDNGPARAPVDIRCMFPEPGGDEKPGVFPFCARDFAELGLDHGYLLAGDGKFVLWPLNNLEQSWSSSSNERLEEGVWISFGRFYVYEGEKWYGFRLSVEKTYNCFEKHREIHEKLERFAHIHGGKADTQSVRSSTQGDETRESEYLLPTLALIRTYASHQEFVLEVLKAVTGTEVRSLREKAEEAGAVV